MKNSAGNSAGKYILENSARFSGLEKLAEFTVLNHPKNFLEIILKFLEIETFLIILFEITVLNHLKNLRENTEIIGNRCILRKFVGIYSI
jgi:hypothetical protein